MAITIKISVCVGLCGKFHAVSKDWINVYTHMLSGRFLTEMYTTAFYKVMLQHDINDRHEDMNQPEEHRFS